MSTSLDAVIRAQQFQQQVQQQLQPPQQQLQQRRPQRPPRKIVVNCIHVKMEERVNIFRMEAVNADAHACIMVNIVNFSNRLVLHLHA